MDSDFRAYLNQYHQEHLIAHWEALDAAAREAFEQQVRQIDFAQLDQLYRGEHEAPDWDALARRAASPPALRLEDRWPFTRKAAIAAGETALRSGQVGALVVAGGQGTRLGFDHAKGMYPVGPVSQASLFQVLFEKVLATSRRYGASIPLYVMTSPATHQETTEYLQQVGNFGLPDEDVLIFCQGTMPAVDCESGRVLLAEQGKLFLAPDGHGGMLPALDASGRLADMQARGLEQIFYFQVDNPLANVCDPLLIGCHRLSESELTTEVVVKRHMRDAMGNVVEADGRVQIIEYSDLNPLPDEVVDRRDPLGRPIFWAGNVAIHVFGVALLQRMAESPTGTPLHVAHKKVPYLNALGQPVEPAEPNAYKFERFIFDLMPQAHNAIVVECDARETFASLKNAEGEHDTPQTVAQQLTTLYRGWLRSAGAVVGDQVDVEISPLFALDEQELIGKIEAGCVIRRPTYFGASGPESR